MFCLCLSYTIFAAVDTPLLTVDLPSLLTATLLLPKAGTILRSDVLHMVAEISFTANETGCTCVDFWISNMSAAPFAAAQGCGVSTGIPMRASSVLSPIPPGLHWIHAAPKFFPGSDCSATGGDDNETSSSLPKGEAVEGVAALSVVERENSAVALNASQPVQLFETAASRTLRFEPRGEQQQLASIYTMWNVLDALMEEADPTNIVEVKYGYIKPALLKLVLQLIEIHGFRTICEVGFNGGHSAAAYLAAHRDIIVHSFDLGHYPYSHSSASFLQSIYNRTAPHRLVMHWGSSQETVPAWSAEADHALCDLVLIDGGHTAEAVAADISNFRPLVNRSAAHAVLFDDTPLNTTWYSDATRAVSDAVKSGALGIVDAWAFTAAELTVNAPLRLPQGSHYNRTTLLADPWGCTLAVYRKDDDDSDSVVSESAASAEAEATSAAASVGSA